MDVNLTAIYYGRTVQHATVVAVSVELANRLIAKGVHNTSAGLMEFIAL